MRILIVEDMVKMAGLIRRGLRNEGIAADVAGWWRSRRRRADIWIELPPTQLPLREPRSLM